MTSKNIKSSCKYGSREGIFRETEEMDFDSINNKFHSKVGYWVLWPEVICKKFGDGVDSTTTLFCDVKNEKKCSFYCKEEIVNIDEIIPKQNGRNKSRV